MSMLLAVSLTCVTGILGAGLGTGLLLALARWVRRIEAGGRRVYLLDRLMEVKMRRRKA